MSSDSSGTLPAPSPRDPSRAAGASLTLLVALQSRDERLEVLGGFFQFLDGRQVTGLVLADLRQEDPVPPLLLHDLVARGGGLPRRLGHFLLVLGELGPLLRQVRQARVVGLDQPLILGGQRREILEAPSGAGEIVRREEHPHVPQSPLLVHGPQALSEERAAALKPRIRAVDIP
jgi:hypothetical protein